MTKQAIVTGASSGLGLLIRKHLIADDWYVHNWNLPIVDVSNELSVYAAASHFFGVEIKLLVNCAGINMINYLTDVSFAEWSKVIDTNVSSIYLCTRVLLEHLRGGVVINIVSNASHVPMTASAAYNASKGAAAILTKQMARELKKTYNITVFSISPNKMKGTGMSEDIDNRVMELRGWTREQAQAYQLAALPAGEETDPDSIAEFIAFLVSKRSRHIYLNGCDIPYGA